jgi:bifunctional DNA-binding transcriptional regulator/antitoxin component of YhaV-PrlF toxin-antitoxin module
MASVGETSKVARAVTGSDSIRATIPKKYADELHLTPGDTLEWDTTTEKGKRYLRARKLE